MSNNLTEDSSGSGFRKKVIASGKLSTLKFVSEVLLRLLSTVVLTRLLAPEVYGVFGVVLLYMYLLEMFSDLGLRSLVLTKEEPVESRFLSSCWCISMLRGGVIMVFSTGVALVIWSLQIRGFFAADNAYAALELPLAVVGLGFGTLIRSAQSPMIYMAERRMDFGRVTLMQIAANLVSLIVTVALAFYLRSIWALVFGVWARSAFEMSISFFLFRNPDLKLKLDTADVWLIYDRARWIVGTSILTAFSTSADRLFLGFFLTSTVFGYYTIAVQMLTIFDRFLSGLNAQMGVQVFRQLLDGSKADFRKNYYRYRLIFDALSGVLVGGLLVSAPVMIDIIFDDRYKDVASILQIISLALLLVGPLILRETFVAERKFKQMSGLSLLTTIFVWGSLAISVFVFNSTTAAFFCIALHRLPEALILLARSYARGWVVLYRELTIVPFLGLGAALGHFFNILFG